jgi:hypothetical protein
MHSRVTCSTSTSVRNTKSYGAMYPLPRIWYDWTKRDFVIENE